MTFVRSSWLLAMVLVTGCSEDTAGNSSGNAPLMSDIEVVFSRNLGDPPGKAYSRIDPKEQLGKAVYGIPPTPGWRDLLKRMAQDEANPLPLVYAEERLFPDGRSYLVAAQLEVRFTGDGGFSPGPVIGCRLFTIDRSDPDKPLLIWRGSESLGTLQNSKVHRGVADPGNAGAFLVIIDEKSGNEFRSRTLRFVPSARSEIHLEKIED